MANNNTEVTTYFVLQYSGNSTYSYDDQGSFIAGLLSTDTHQNQVEIVREFIWETALSGVRPTAEELKTVYTLPRENSSGSPMYTLDETAKTITFNTDDPNTAYYWIDGVHHSRGGGHIELPGWKISDVVTIRRKTPVKNTDQTWATGSKVTASRLNQQFGQLLNIAQEIRSFLLNPTVFDTYIGTKNGICPLDSNAKVALNYIPYSLGGTGSDNAVDVSGIPISEFANVSSNTPSATLSHLIWDVDEGEWTPKAPLSNLVTNLDSGVDGQILQWTGLVWSLVTFELDSMADVDIDSSANARVTGDILYWDNVALRWKNTAWGTASAPENNQVLMWVDNKWIPQTYEGAEVSAEDLSGHSISECGDVTYFGAGDPWSVNDTRHGDIMALAGYGTDNIKIRPKSVDIYDLNDVGGGVGDQLPSVVDGHVLMWDNSLSQNDDWGGQPAGCWTWGVVGNLTPGLDFSSTQSHDVLQLDVLGDWKLAQLNLYHLGDVLVSWRDVAADQTLLYDADNEGWIVGDLPSGFTSLGGEAQFLTVTKSYKHTVNGVGALLDEDYGTDWFETFVWSGNGYIEGGNKELVPRWYHIMGLNSTNTPGTEDAPTLEWLVKKTDWAGLAALKTWDEMYFWKDGALTGDHPPNNTGDSKPRFSTVPTGGTPGQYSRLRGRKRVVEDPSDLGNANNRLNWIDKGILRHSDVLVFRPRYNRAPPINGNYAPMSIQIVFEVMEEGAND